MSRYIASAEPTEIIKAEAELLPNPSNDPSRRNIDIGTSATLAFPNDVTASISCHGRRPGWGPFGLFPYMPDVNLKVTCEGGTIELSNYVAPTIYHSLTVIHTDAKGKPRKKRVEKVYKFLDGFGEEWWST